MTDLNLFISQLEQAADNADTMSREELAILLRRAALRLRNIDTGLRLVKGEVGDTIGAFDLGPGADTK